MKKRWTISIILITLLLTPATISAASITYPHTTDTLTIDNNTTENINILINNTGKTRKIVKIDNINSTIRVESKKTVITPGEHRKISIKIHTTHLGTFSETLNVSITDGSMRAIVYGVPLEGRVIEPENNNDTPTDNDGDGGGVGNLPYLIVLIFGGGSYAVYSRNRKKGGNDAEQS